jgi:hypothetical protein
MLWLILAPCAVYAAVCVALLWLSHRLILPIRAPVALILALAPLLLTGRALLTGGVYAPIDIPYQAPPLSVHASEQGIAGARSPALSDVAAQMIPWRKAVRDAVKNGRLPLWNRFLLAGDPLLAAQQPGVLHPGTWISMLLPLAQSWTLDMSLRFFAALLFAYLFLRDIGCRETAALLGAAGWAFCDYLVFFVGWPVNPSAAPLPLLLLGLRRLVSRGNGRAVVLTVVALLLIMTSGHPETVLHCVAAGAIYFLFELAWAGRGRLLRPLLLSLLAGVLTLGLSAVILLPFLESVPLTLEYFVRRTYYVHAHRSLPTPESLRHALLNLMPYFFGVPGKGETVSGQWEMAGYGGSVLWPFAVAGAASRSRVKWPLLVIGIVGLSVGARFPGITDLVARLPLFDVAINERMIFLAAFAFSALAGLGLDRFARGDFGRLCVAVSLLASLVLFALCVLARPNLERLAMPRSYLNFRLLAQIVPLISVAGLVLAARRRSRVFVCGCFLALLLAQRGVEQRDVYPTYPNRAFYPPVAAFDKIPRPIPFRFAALGFSFIPNIAALYELEDVRGYEAMTFLPLFETYRLWSVHQAVWFNRIDDPTSPFLSFLNVRWFYASPGFRPPAGWPELYRGPDGVLLENPAVLPRAFVPRELAYESDPQLRLSLLSKIPDFAARGVVGEKQAAGLAAGSWEKNGEASVRIVSYLPERMTLSVEAKDPAVIATSMTAWPGWKLAVDGKKTRLLSYNHAFLGFRVPRGRHEAVLHYMPDSFVAGSVISLGTLMIGLTLLLRRSRAA